ncbi:MAG: DUF3460 domain-containing protein [Haemophilus parainfluenzae]|jgi:PREDICTED: similar to catechol-O-methyltransferase domain containing 1, partial|nr:MAG: DUF3460 domain-containing protein [Haemophilus parainfluenzae]
MYHYTSDVTDFIRDFLKKHPEERKRQLRHRNKLWDVHLNQNELSQFDLGALHKKPYTYFPNPQPWEYSSFLDNDGEEVPSEKTD